MSIFLVLIPRIKLTTLLLFLFIYFYKQNKISLLKYENKFK